MRNNINEARASEERSGAAGPYYQLQHGRKGQNHTRYVPADELVGWLLQQAAERADARYQPKPGESRKGRETLRVQCIFGTFELSRDYYYHAGKEHPDYQTQLRRWAKLLLKDKVPALIDQTRKQGVGKPQPVAVEKELGYFVRNLSRMQYGTFRAKGYFIGSGVVEAGCKTVIGSRCKQSGMFWSEAGAVHRHREHRRRGNEIIPGPSLPLWSKPSRI